MWKFTLQKMKPERFLVFIFMIVIFSLFALIAKDVLIKRDMNKILDHAKGLISEVALNLPKKQNVEDIVVASKYLQEKAPLIKEIIIQSNNHLKIQFNKNDKKPQEDVFIFYFESIDELSRGNLKCLSGTLPKRIMPNQCR
ncbi:hypothetical protein [Ignatzschineria sp. LJL83]